MRVYFQSSRGQKGNSGQSVTRLTATTLAEQLACETPPLVVDVRNDKERQEKRIEGSFHIPLTRLRERIGELPRDKNLVVHCAGGYRSSMAASLLRQFGIKDVCDLLGGDYCMGEIRVRDPRR